MPSTSTTTSERTQAARYLQRLDDARTFARYAEQALVEAAELSPDAEAFRGATSMRRKVSEVRRGLQAIKQAGSSRFNPKRMNHSAQTNGAH